MKKRPLRVLFVIDTIYLGGRERRLLELLKGLAQQDRIKYELVVLSDKIFYSDVGSLNIVIHKLVRKFKMDPSIYWSLFKICRRFRPHVIHSWESMCSVYAAPIARLLRTKFINGMVSNAPVKLKFLGKHHVRAKLTFPMSDLIISNSRAGLNSFNVPRNKAVCVHNGFNFSRLNHLKTTEQVKSELGINDQQVVGMVARFEDNKDFETYILSAKKILAKRNNVVFLAIGDGKNLEKIKNFTGPNFDGQIMFLGKRNNVESIVKIFDIGVLSSFMEGISNSIMEYMALAKPVIATDIKGNRELVLNRQTGFLVSSGNEDEMSEKIEYLLDHSEEAEMMGRAGKKRIQSEFDISRMVDRYIQIYNRCVTPP